MPYRCIFVLIQPMSKWFYGGLPKSVYVLFVARIINRLGDFVRFFLTLYLTRVLGMTETSTGLVVTLASAAVMAGTLGGGKFADRFGRKRIMLVSQVLSAAVIGVCGFIPAHTALPALLIVSQFFLGALRPASGALVMDLTPPEKRQRAFSLLYLGINIGVALGPMIAGFLFENYRRWIFFGDAITTMVGVFLVWRFVPETSSETAYRSENHRERSFDGSTFRAFLSRPVLAAFTAVLVVTSMVYSQFHFGLPLLVNEVFRDNSARFFGVISSVNAVTVIVFTPLILKLLERRAPLKNMAAGCAAYAAGFGILAITVTGYWFFLLSTVLWTWGEIIFATNVNVFISSHTPFNHRGRFNAVTHLAMSLGQTIAPAAAGVIIAGIGVRGIWLPILFLSAASGAGMAVLHRVDVNRGRSNP